MGALVRSQGVDLAVMRFHGAVPAGYEPVPIYEGQKPTPGMQVTVMGYGVTILNGTEIGTLRATSLRVIAQPVESRTINVEGVPLTDILTSDLRDDQFTLPSTQSGVCQGDSGGPAYGFFNGQLMLVGITASSYGTEAVTSKFAQCKTYSIHTYAFPHEHWIAQTVAQMRLNPKFGALDPNAK
jgi:secreted trypsin-like serine protease